MRSVTKSSLENYNKIFKFIDKILKDYLFYVFLANAHKCLIRVFKTDLFSEL